MTRRNFSRAINFTDLTEVYCEATSEVIIKIQGFAYNSNEIYIALIDHTQGQGYIVKNNILPSKLLKTVLKTKLYDINHVEKEGHKVVVKDYIFDELCDLLFGIQAK